MYAFPAPSRATPEGVVMPPENVVMAPTPRTPTDAEAVLFPGLGSSWSAETVATVAAVDTLGGGTAVIVTVAEPAAARVPRLHEAVDGVVVHDPWVVDAF